MSAMHRTSPSRYEYFEAWLTPKEWATWKKYTTLSVSQRDSYLRAEIPFNPNNHPEVCDAWDDMINYNLRWIGTPQGQDYWQSVAERTRPIRTL